MGDIGKDLAYSINKQQAPADPMPGPQAAIVISADASGVRVKIPSFHPDWAFGPAKYSWPSTGYPPAGTPCLVEFVGTDLTQPWIVAWQTAPGTLFNETGTTATARFVGGTPSGAPTSGAFQVGDYVIDQTGATWICTVGGSPGTWRASYTGAGLTGATAASRYVGATTAGPPASGTFVVGDWVVDQSGVMWICTTAGTPGTWTVPNRRPTGDVEMTIRTTAKPNSLMLNGQTVSRTTYAGLWAWAQANTLVVTGLFTTGDGTTTFGLPDFRGRVPRGVAATGEAIGALLGSDTQTLSVSNMPSHNHSVSANGVGDHDHFIAYAGNHGRHPAYQIPVAAGSGANDVYAGPETDPGDHNHNMNWNGGHNHSINESNVGGGTAFDNRQASIGVNWLIWT